MDLRDVVTQKLIVLLLLLSVLFSGLSTYSSSSLGIFNVIKNAYPQQELTETTFTQDNNNNNDNNTNTGGPSLYGIINVKNLTRQEGNTTEGNRPPTIAMPEPMRDPQAFEASKMQAESMNLSSTNVVELPPPNVAQGSSSAENSSSVINSNNNNSFNTALSSSSSSSPSPASHFNPSGRLSFINHIPSTLFGFEGLEQNGAVPPDVNIAAGPNHIVEIVNRDIMWYEKQSAATNSLSLNIFFSARNDFLTDPRILFDITSGRWFASIADFTTSSVRVAVSNSDDPTTGWMLYNFLFASPCPDRPQIGLSRDKFVISVDNFSIKCDQYNGWQYTVVDKGAMVRGVSSPGFQSRSTIPPDPHIHVLPVSSDSLTLYMVYIVEIGPAYSIDLYSINGVPNAVTRADVLVTRADVLDLQLPVMNVPPDADQPGTEIKISTGDNRIQDAVWLQGRLWLTLNNVCRPEGDIENRACFRLVSIDTNRRVVVQDFDVGRRYSHFFFPALSLDYSGGNLVVIYGTSSDTVYPSLEITGLHVGRPPSELGPAVLLISGTASVNYSSLFPDRPEDWGRYGDYFGADVDPCDPSVWVAGEYHTEPDSWSTYIGNTRTPQDRSIECVPIIEQEIPCLVGNCPDNRTIIQPSDRNTTMSSPSDPSDSGNDVIVTR